MTIGTGNTAVKSIWEYGRLVFRRKSDGAGLFAISASSRFTRFLTITALADDDTITAAAIKGGLITYADAACGGTLTFDTAENIDAAFPGIQVGECIEFYIVNTGSTTGTLAEDDACCPTVTIIDVTQTIAANESAKVVLRKSAADAYVAYVDPEPNEMVAEAVKLQTYDFSYSLHGEQTKTFRLTAPGEAPFYVDRTKGFEGYVWIEDADGKTGHMTITMIIDRLNSGQMIFYLPDGYVQERMQREGLVVPGDAEYAELNQFCFARKQEQWRTWDKTRREATMQYVDGYYGPVYASWHDGGGHFFGHGRKWFADVPGKGRVAMMAGDAP